MTISVNKISTQNVNGGSLTITTSFATLPASGDEVTVFLGLYGVTAVSSVADNQGVGNTYAVAPNASVLPGASSAGCAIYRCKSIGATSGTFTITATVTGSGTAMRAVAISVSGLQANPDDKGSASSKSAASSTYTQTNGAANTNANDLVCAMVYVDTGGSTNTITDPPTGYTSIAVDQTNGTAPSWECAYKIVSATETSSATWNYTNNTGGPTSCAAVATFMGTAAAAGPLTKMDYFYQPYVAQ